MKKEIIYICECGKEQARNEMRREFDFDYDQLCCVKCGDVLFDDLRGLSYVKIKQIRYETTK